jgi:hypothetical protein
MREFLHHEDGDGKGLPDGEFLVDISTHRLLL